MSVSIVMPCYNEEEVIEKVVKDYYGEIITKIGDSEFIVVDDCSTDNTHKILERLKRELPALIVLKTPVNSGHGKTMRAGYEAAGKKWVFEVDSDNQFAAKDFWKLYELRDRYDFMLGRRKSRHDPLHRLVLSAIIRFSNLIFFKVWINDANCPFRLIRKDVLDKFLAHIPKEALAPNLTISVLAGTEKIPMAEVPITHFERKTGRVRLVSLRLLTFALKGFRQLLQVKKP